jgi:hypothetical protein
MSGRTTRTHGDAGSVELFADRAPVNAQLGRDLAQAPTLGVQVSRTLDVHCDTVTSLSRTMSGLVQESAQRQFVFICQWAATRLGEAPARRRWRRSSRAPRPHMPFAMSLHTFTKAKLEHVSACRHGSPITKRIHNVPVWRTRPPGGALWLETAMCLGRWLYSPRPR